MYVEEGCGENASEWARRPERPSQRARKSRTAEEEMDDKEEPRVKPPEIPRRPLEFYVNKQRNYE